MSWELPKAEGLVSLCPPPTAHPCCLPSTQLPAGVLNPRSLSLGGWVQLHSHAAEAAAEAEAEAEAVEAHSAARGSVSLRPGAEKWFETPPYPCLRVMSPECRAPCHSAELPGWSDRAAVEPTSGPYLGPPMVMVIHL